MVCCLLAIWAGPVLAPAGASGDAGVGAVAAHRTGPAGGSSSANATALAGETSYSGVVTPGARSWYRFRSGDGERAWVALRGRTACPVHMALLDAQGRTLGEIVSNAGETEPFLVYFPSRPVADEYFLLVDSAHSARPCGSAAYVFTLEEPEQPSCESRPPAHPGEQEAKSCVEASKESALPYTSSPYLSAHCTSAGRTYRRAASVVSRARGRIGASALRRLKRALAAARLAVHVNCHLG